jgi:hypothetical protein
MTGPFDERERHTAAQITRRNPYWLVIWGRHSRLYWAFPRFNAPPGTIIAAPDTAELLALMRHTELAAAPGRR